MEELLHEFETGPYEVLNYQVKTTDDGKVVIDLNENDLGRLPVENLETIEQLREALDKAEAYFKEAERRKEEF